MYRQFLDYRNPKVREYMTVTIRRVVEDYELLHALEQKGLNDIREKLFAKVLPNPDVTQFYDKDGKTIVTFKQISMATQEDYDMFRKEACNLLYV